MSVNQSRVERTEGQIKKSARAGSAGQQRGFVGGWKGGVSAPPPISYSSTVPPSPVSLSLSTSRSFKKSFNGQSQTTTCRGNASSGSSGAAPSAAGHRALENGAQPQTHSLGFSDGLDPRAAKPVDMPISASQTIPKAPSSQSGAGFSNSQSPSAPAKGDASKTVTIQFGSITPGIMNALQIPVPARTSSASPNLDEQVRNQTGSDISDALLVNPSGHSPSPSTGRVNDRPSGASPAVRRTVASMDDEKWLKPHVSFGRDIRTDYGDGNATVSHVVLKTLPQQISNQGILSSPMPSPVSQVGLLHGNPDVDRWQRARGLIPPLHTPLQIMHKAEKKYEVGNVFDEENAKQRQLKAILNKLTPQNFDKLFDQVREVSIDCAMTLTGVISQIFDKALMEPTFCEMYANFCFRLATMLPDFSEDNEKITFKRLLLNKCQEEFERGEKEQAEGNKDEEEGETKQFKEEREENRLRARRRMLGNICLLGELYKKKMLTERIMHECIKKLLGQSQNPDEEDIEALCKLMSTIGEMIDHPKAKEHMDAYFDMMAKLSTNQKLSSRVRFMLRDAIDLRKNKWQQRRKVEGTKKIEGVLRDAAQERQAHVKQRQLIAILSKLTPQNFDKLFGQVRELNIDNVMILAVVVLQICDKALMEPTLCEMYANLCFRLASVLPDFSEDNEKITFKRLLLNKCQEEFERGEKEQAEANKDEEEDEIKQSKEEKEEKRLRARRRMLGNICLIGELYKKKMLTERIMHECIKKLLGQSQNPDEEDIEALCKLMSTIGEMIDHPKAKEHMDVYFDMMAKLSTNQKLSSRVRFMLRDAIDLRKNKWQHRRKV